MDILSNFTGYLRHRKRIRKVNTFRKQLRKEVDEVFPTECGVPEWMRTRIVDKALRGKSTKVYSEGTWYLVGRHNPKLGNTDVFGTPTFEGYLDFIPYRWDREVRSLGEKGGFSMEEAS